MKTTAAVVELAAVAAAAGRETGVVDWPEDAGGAGRIRPPLRGGEDTMLLVRVGWDQEGVAAVDDLLQSRRRVQVALGAGLELRGRVVGGTVEGSDHRTTAVVSASDLFVVAKESILV